MLLVKTETFRGGERISLTTGWYNDDFKHAGKTYDINWGNLSDMYMDLGIHLPFILYDFKRGLWVSFYNFNLFKRKTWDAVEWHGKPLDVQIKFTVIDRR